MQMQLASKTKGQKDDVTVIVIDAMPSEDMRMPPALQQKKSTSTMIARYCSCQAWCSRLWIILIMYRLVVALCISTGQMVYITKYPLHTHESIMWIPGLVSPTEIERCKAMGGLEGCNQAVPLCTMTSLSHS